MSTNDHEYYNAKREVEKITRKHRRRTHDLSQVRLSTGWWGGEEGDDLKGNRKLEFQHFLTGLRMQQPPTPDPPLVTCLGKDTSCPCLLKCKMCICKLGRTYISLIASRPSLVFEKAYCLLYVKGQIYEVCILTA